MSPKDITDGTTVPHSVVRTKGLGEERRRPAGWSSGRSVDWSDTIEDQPTEEAVLQISGAGHWFLEGWIGDHSVDFLVDSGSAVTASSYNFYQALVRAGAPVGVLRPTARHQWFTDRDLGMFVLCGAVPGAPDGVSHSGVRSEHIANRCYYWDRVRWDQYCHIPWISRKYCCLQREVYPFNCTAGTPHCRAASSRWDIVPFHHVLRRYYIIPHIQWVAGRCRPVAFWRVSRFSRKTRAWWWAGRWWTHRDGEFRCWYLILARRP